MPVVWRHVRLHLHLERILPVVPSRRTQAKYHPRRLYSQLLLARVIDLQPVRRVGHQLHW